MGPRGRTELDFVVDYLIWTVYYFPTYLSAYRQTDSRAWRATGVWGFAPMKRTTIGWYQSSHEQLPVSMKKEKVHQHEPRGRANEPKLYHASS